MIQQKLMFVVTFIGCFDISIQGHLNSKYGCRLCAIYGNKIPLEYIIDKAVQMHGEKYDYSLVTSFTNNKEKINVICNMCNKTFFTRVDMHVNQGRGCPNCKKAQIYTKQYYLSHGIPEHPVWLYLVQFENEDEKFLKIGFTIHENVRKRFRGHRLQYNISVIYKINLMFFNAYDIEQSILRKFNNFKHYPLIKFKGHTECLNYNQKELLLSILLEIIE